MASAIIRMAGIEKMVEKAMADACVKLPLSKKLITDFFNTSQADAINFLMGLFTTRNVPMQKTANFDSMRMTWGEYSSGP